MAFSFQILRLAMENLTPLSVWDAVIAGGGPAGSACAVWLARAGRSVLLIEKEASAHHKVCGEFISGEAAHYLDGLGISLPALGAKTVRRARLVQGISIAEAALPTAGYSLSRKALDDALLEAADGAGAKILRGETVRDISAQKGVFTVSTRGAGDFTCGAAFLATGKHDLGEIKRRPGNSEDVIGFKMHCVPKAGVICDPVAELFFFPGGYAGLEPVEDGLVNLCLVIRRTAYAACGKNWTRLLAGIAEKAPLLGERFRALDPCWVKPLAVYPLPYGFFSRPEKGAPPLYRLGDQMAVIPSFCGEGISFALHSAALAAKASLACDPSFYYRAVKRDFRKQMLWADLASRALCSPVQAATVNFCSVFPDIIQTLFEKTRISPLTWPDNSARPLPAASPSLYSATGP